MSNYHEKAFLKSAAERIKGELATVREDIAKGNEKKKGILWLTLCDLLCYAHTEVFKDGYTKKAAKAFKTDLMTETGLSEKQAAKYTESISAGLGVRGVRKGMREIKGLPTACDDTVSVQAFLNAAEIDTFNKFQKAVRTDLTPVQAAAKMLSKLTPIQRGDAVKMAAKMDSTDDSAESEEADKK